MTVHQSHVSCMLKSVSIRKLKKQSDNAFITQESLIKGCSIVYTLERDNIG